MFKRIAVVNRGESAVRLIRAVRELNAEHGYGIQSIAMHTDAERRAMFVRQADDAVCIRPTGPGNAYLDHEALADALRRSGADAVWVGWGFVAEDPAFADMIRRMGITFIGPSPEAMKLLGDKVEAKLLAEKVGVPVAPWSGGPVETRADARRHAQAIGYPLIIKSRSGGGGRGIRKVYAEDELELALERTQGEAERSFGDPVVFIERLVTDARHVEVQIIADKHGNVWAPGVRDCSIQRRNQKVIEESSSVLMTEEQKDHLRTVSADLVHAAGYHGAATVEYLYQPSQQIFTFLEVNTRLQVEHPITEITTGIDLVKLQILTAAGEKLEGDCPPEFGHGVEARLNAEDAENGFAPAPGTVKLCKFPLGSGLRVDTGIAQGDVIPPDYDSMVAKIIAWGRDRDEALARLRTALRETTVVLDGGTTTKSFLLALLDEPDLISGAADTGWLDKTGAGVGGAPGETAEVALLAAAAHAYDVEESVERTNFLSSARGGRPRASHTIGRTVELSYLGQAYKLTVGQISPRSYLIEGDFGEVEVGVDRLGLYESRLTVHGRRHQVVTVAGPAQYLVEVDGVSHQISQDEAGVVRAPAPAVVVAVPVAVGDQVEAGDQLVVLEAMKMETAVRAPIAGRVSEVVATVNSQVDAGAALIRVEPEGEEGAATAAAPRIEFTPSTASTDAGQDPRERALHLIEVMASMITGYDVPGERAQALLDEYQQLRSGLADDSAIVDAELNLLTTFADVCELSRNRPTYEEESGDESVHSPREHFHAFLYSLDSEREGLPPSFQENLARALRHYGVTPKEVESDASDRQGQTLEEAVYRVFLSQQRTENQIPVVAALLERWLSDAAGSARPADAGTTHDADPLALADADAAATPPEQLAEVLDRLIVATQLRYPVIGDAARNLRFRLYDQPRIAQTRQDSFDRIRGVLARLAENPRATDYTRRIARLISTPEPLTDLLAAHVARDAAEAGPLLDVITRRYYDIRDLTGVELTSRGGHHFVTGSYTLQGDTLRLVSALGSHDSISELLDEVDGITAGVYAGGADGERTRTLVTDLYITWPETITDPDAVGEELRTLLAGRETTGDGRRVTFTVCSDTGPNHQFTFRPDADGAPQEEVVIRDLHPLTAQRLDLWRLKNFVGTRMPAAPGTYLYHLEGRENPSDERLIALAEVRDATPEFDAAGEVVGMPEIERTLTACLDGIRRAQGARAGKRRLDANRVVLYIWPTITLAPDRIEQIARNIAPITQGAGIEQIILMASISDAAEPGQGGAGQAGTRDVAVRFSYRSGAGVVMSITEPPARPMQPVSAYTQKVQRSRARGTVYPYELIPLLTGPDGTFVEHDLADDGTLTLAPVDRPYGENKAGIITGVVTIPTERYPEGVKRVALFGDPTRALGTVAEAECSRVVAALTLAEELGAPVEWFTLSSGATIAMDSGTENMDWVSRALRKIITFTQNGGEINVVVAGINVGAQPYWNAEATMLMHTKGILVMTPDSAMVLTGKQSLDYSGGVSAEDNFGIGGYDRVMGPNGQAQYWAPNLSAACEVLVAHYEHSYVAPGERFPRRAVSTDPVDRDVRSYPHVHPGSDFTTVGEIFSAEKNLERKKPFDIRTVMRAVVDQDHAPLERWADMKDADTSVVFDAHLDGNPVSVIGIESRAIPRKGWFPADGPDTWTAGTLFPASSWKTARAINAASGVRPIVVLANLSGFDGSPESLRNLQLQYGAEIGRAIVNFDGPIVFCVVSRYHGGAFVVFSGALNDNMEVLAVEGSYASVLGGAPAAAVVFTREVNKRTKADETVRRLEAELAAATTEAEQARVGVELSAAWTEVRSAKLGEVASEFEAVHNIERAREVGSVHTIVSAEQLRPQLIAAVERGMKRASE
ncbi:biotin carboxylase N-terminal domain-containing protein [Tomitella fengzijianii]|uniref:biotin carboxylase n=1 Tax=Tomitella fengzijianii TaxID=2597660 RepID=A0A516X8M6_9ACTN|nr:biotin carboxylase N-terminal domain-containing protein [Tomitella fengzijianii]QDQ99430.1 ATP-grasp domain-containing protein [Tomitella fengzijianii]